MLILCEHITGAILFQANGGQVRKFAAGAVGAFAAALSLSAVGPAHAEQAVTCGGQALPGGALLMCSHVAPDRPTQSCTFSWALVTASNAVQVEQGSFLLPPGAKNLQVYQGAGFLRASSPPIVVCQGSQRP